MVKYLASAWFRHQQQLDGSGQGMRKRKGPISDKAQLAILTGQVRRELSLEAVRARAQCLPGWMDLGLVHGAASAAKIGGNYKRPKSKIAVWGIGVVLRG